MADPTVTEYPQALAGIVREALRTPQTDDTFFHQLVQLSFFQDRQWLAGREAERSVRAADDWQRDVLGYFVLKARAILEEYPGPGRPGPTPHPALGGSPRPAWAEREVTWFADLLQDVVHSDFGTMAVSPAEIINELIRDRCSRWSTS